MDSQYVPKGVMRGQEREYIITMENISSMRAYCKRATFRLSSSGATNPNETGSEVGLSDSYFTNGRGRKTLDLVQQHKKKNKLHFYRYRIFQAVKSG